jgi:hypothetical protein
MDPRRDGTETERALAQPPQQPADLRIDQPARLRKRLLWNAPHAR